MGKRSLIVYTLVVALAACSSPRGGGGGGGAGATAVEDLKPKTIETRTHEIVKLVEGSGEGWGSFILRNAISPGSIVSLILLEYFREHRQRIREMRKDSPEATARRKDLSKA